VKISQRLEEMFVKTIFRALCPPIIWRGLSHLNKREPETGFFGRYKNWSETGADDVDDVTAEALKERAKLAAKKLVAPGNQIASRDGPLAIALLTAARSSTRSPFKVIDFGGSLATHVPLFLTIAPDIPFEWTIIEQDLLVNVGRAIIPKNIPVIYSTTLAEAPGDSDIIIASGSLQCVYEPYRALRDIRDLKPNFIFVDRIPIVEDDEDFASVQKAPVSLYSDGRARKFAVWFFSRRHFYEEATKGFRIIWSAKPFSDSAVLDGKPLIESFEAVLLQRV
jgi:putative methyltransferase (TIGR04325 family)